MSTPQKRQTIISLGLYKSALWRDLHKIWGFGNSAGLIATQNDDEAIDALKKSRASVLVFGLENPAQLKTIAAFLARAAAEAPHIPLIWVVISKLHHPSLPKLLKKMGCKEEIDGGVIAKGLKLKLQRLVTVLEAIHGQTKQAAPQIAKTSTDAETTKQKTVRKALVNETAPLSVSDDCWITSASASKRVQEMWMITVMGPGATAGRWVKTNHPGATSQPWLWTPHKPDVDPFVKYGKWIFIGRQPEFKNYQWTFTSKTPELLYLEAGKVIAKRFSLDSVGDLILPRNSSFAEQKVPLMKASFEYSIYLKNEKGPPDSLPKYFEKNKEKFTPDYTIEVDPNAGKLLEIELSQEEAKDWNNGLTPDEAKPDWNGLKPEKDTTDEDEEDPYKELTAGFSETKKGTNKTETKPEADYDFAKPADSSAVYNERDARAEREAKAAAREAAEAKAAREAKIAAREAAEAKAAREAKIAAREAAEAKAAREAKIAAREAAEAKAAHEAKVAAREAAEAKAAKETKKITRPPQERTSPAVPDPSAARPSQEGKSAQQAGKEEKSQNPGTQGPSKMSAPSGEAGADILEDLQKEAKEAGFMPEVASPPPKRVTLPKSGFGNKTYIQPQRLKLYSKALAKLAPKPGLFQVVGDPEERLSYLKEVKLLNSPATIWTPHQKLREVSKVDEFSLETKTFRIQYPTGFSQSGFRSALDTHQADRVYFNVNLNRTALFFAQSRSELDMRNDGFHVPLPDSIYEVQRRAHFRLKISDDRNFIVELGPSGSGRIIDISAGGLGVEVEPQIAQRYKQGDILPNISFEIYGKRLHCSGQVRWIKQGKAEHAIGLKFIKLDPFDAEGIHLFVMEENFDYINEHLV